MFWGHAYWHKRPYDYCEMAQDGDICNIGSALWHAVSAALAVDLKSV